MEANITDRIERAESCQKWAWLYENARDFAQAGDEKAARLVLTQLWERVPHYGDPSHIAPRGTMPPKASPRTSKSMVKVPSLVVDARNDFRVFEITTIPFTIGRAKESDLYLQDQTLSLRHAEIVRDGTGRFGVRDLQSSNGTYVNGHKVASEMWLKNGDVIEVGRIALRFELPLPWAAQ